MHTYILYLPLRIESKEVQGEGEIFCSNAWEKKNIIHKVNDDSSKLKHNLDLNVGKLMKHLNPCHKRMLGLTRLLLL
jgi:hypothetical protein